MAEVRFVEAPKIARIQVQACTRTDGKKTHKYVDGVCQFCGFKNPYKQRSGVISKEKGPSRASPLAVSQAKARSIIFGAGAVTQRLVLQLIEEEKRGEWAKDALSGEELLLLSDALADEAIRSKRIMSWLAALDRVGPHAKLMTVVVILTLPRLARHNMIPQEVADELSNAAALALASGAPRDDYRGDLRRQVDFGGGGIVTTPDIPAGEPEQNGSSPETGEISSRGGDEESSHLNGREVQPDRVEAESTDTGDSGSGVLPSPTASVAARRMDRVRRRGVVS